MLVVFRVTSLSNGRAVPRRGLWEHIQVPVAFGVHRRLEDGVRQSDRGFQVCGTGTPQRLEPRQPGTGEIQLFQAVDRDDCRGNTPFIMLLLFSNQFQEKNSLLLFLLHMLINVSSDGPKQLDLAEFRTHILSL